MNPRKWLPTSEEELDDIDDCKLKHHIDSETLIWILMTIAVVLLIISAGLMFVARILSILGI